jgi:hypothetical protein
VVAPDGMIRCYKPGFDSPFEEFSPLTPSPRGDCDCWCLDCQQRQSNEWFEW